MYDQYFKQINLGDKIIFSCGMWIYQAIVYKITDEYISHRQINKGNGEGQSRDSNRIECERYVTVINLK